MHLSLRPRLLMDQFALGGLGPCATPGTPPCCGHDCTTCLYLCTGCHQGGIPLVGATVTAGGYSGTTGSDGCAMLAGLPDGNYSTQVTHNNTSYGTLPRSFVGGMMTTGFVYTNPPDFICCRGYAIPTTLHLTDGQGSVTLTASTSSNPPTWSGSALFPGGGTPVLGTPQSCYIGTHTNGQICRMYQLVCNTSGPINQEFTLTRTWSMLNTHEDAQLNLYFDYWLDNEVVGVIPCGCGGYLGCAPAFAIQIYCNDANATTSPTTGNPFAINFPDLVTPPPTPGYNYPPDPVGGGANISA